MPDHVDVLIVGAGLSGISAAWHLQDRCPGRSYAIVEAREALGGTWDLFRYPGIRSDSDKYTFGYRFKPWRGSQALADGPDIRAYIEETAREHGIDRRIRYQHRMVSAEWSSEEARWTVHLEVGPDRTPAQITCGFLYACTGYYDYDQGHSPTWPGMEAFQGKVVHPQHWPEDLDTSGLRIVIIGSGATAVTLVPALAKTAAHVTMLQRSPTYVAALPSEDAAARALQRTLPPRAAHRAIRWKNILKARFYYRLARRHPRLMKRLLRRAIRDAVGPDVDVDRHFQPAYDPWDQRLCLAPDGDLFTTLATGAASVVTDRIERFTPTGLQLESGEHLEADLVVTATGLRIQLLGGATMRIDDAPVDFSERIWFKGAMYSDVPNFALAFGYTNASWTLKCDLIAEHVCRLLNRMERDGFTVATPRPSQPLKAEPAVDLTSGYVRRALDRIPKQGDRAPWRVHQDYLRDLALFRYGPVLDDELELR